MKNQRGYLFILGVLVIVLFTSLLKKDILKPKSNTEEYTSLDSKVNFQNGPVPNADFINADGSVSKPNFSTFPEGYTLLNGGVSVAAFHELSYQTFLWLMSETENGKLLFEEMYNSDAIHPDEPNPKKHTLGGIMQVDYRVLVDENSNPVYTTLMINPTYRDFVHKHKLYTVEGMEAAADTLNFPVGSMSMKASWKILEDKNDPLYKTAYVVKNANVYKPIYHNGKLTTSELVYENGKYLKTTYKADVALVGFHIAVVPKDHYEFVWATFEHKNNAPNFNPQELLKEGIKNPYDQVVYDGDKNYTFYKNGTKAKDSNVSDEGLKFSVDEETNKIYVDNKPYTTQVYRRLQFGGGSEINRQNIDSLNRMVYKKLPENSIWRNYFEVGGVWFKNKTQKIFPGWTPEVNFSLMNGSTALCNSTIETFTQEETSIADNCFGCHFTKEYTYKNKTLKGKNILTSHILLQNYLDSFVEPEEQPVLVHR
ncbi:hypothetical protein [Aureivirga marina]|uniref:hypothetical protein n=1 Tax=Aureivirga marina TaxID=1182451 RepID=UPI0018CB3A8A|nr:hypothetical protein [Aureivirga marina]